MLFDALTTTGIFLLGASAGALVTYERCKRVLNQYSQMLEVEKPSTPAEAEAQFALKALVVGNDAEMISLFSRLFREKGIQLRKLPLQSAAIDQLSSEKFEALLLDFDESPDCGNILYKLPPPNEKLLVIAVATDDSRKEAATRAGATFVVERPLIPAQIRERLQIAYGRMLRDGQQYFRLAIELPVSIRDVKGTVRQCTTLNVSQTGMAVRGPSSFITGESITLAFAVPNTEIWVSAEGTVIWDDKHGKTGLSFQCINALAQSRYYEWLHEHFFMRQGHNGPDTSEQVAHVR